MKQVVRKNRSAAVWGALAGLLVLGGWIGYVIAVTPNRPVIESAAPADVVAYVCDDRGLSRLPQIEQEEFLKKWHAHLVSGSHATALQDHLVSLDEDARGRFVDVIFKHLKRGFLTDAKQYATLKDPGEKGKFIRDRFARMESQSGFMREIGKAFARDFTGGVTFQEWLMQKTSPEERELGTPYYEALMSAREQIRKEQRAATAAPAAESPDRTAARP